MNNRTASLSPNGRRRCAAAALALAGWLLAGCEAHTVTPPPVTLRQYNDPSYARGQTYPPQTVILHNLQRVMDGQLDANSRADSLRLVAHLGGDEPEVRSQLAVMLGDGATPEPLRRACLELLLQRDQPDLAAHVAAALPRLDSSEELKKQVLAWLARHPAPAVLGEVVRLWSLEPSATTANEPRYRMIVERLTGKDWQSGLLEAVNRPDFPQPGAAVQVLGGRMDRAELARRVAAMTPRTDAAAGMQAFARRFNYVPTTAAGVALCAAQHGSTEAMDGAAWLSAVWRQQYGYRFEPWDFPLLAKLSRDPLRRNVTRAQLIIDLAYSFLRRRHVPRHVDRRVGLYDFSDQFSKHVESLSLADLWRLRLLDEMLQRPVEQAALRSLAERDRADVRGAWGGLIFLTAGQAEARIYPQAEGAQLDDLAYQPTEQAVRDRPGALCVFHGHFEKIDNTARAGPTADELIRARREGFCGVVLASVGEGLFCAHYYNPEGIVISMGKFPFR